MALAKGTVLGRYEITAPIGAGGMGEVYRARDSKLDRSVAIKILPQSVATDPERLARFAREAKTLAALNHPNIAIIHGLEDADGVQALVMELVEGPTLAQRIADGAIPVGEALPIARQIAEALEAAHEHGVIHRDLKPANIKVRLDGMAKVLDFGLAKIVSPSAPDADATASPTITSPALLTGAGLILGTAAYMSPEQAKGRRADKRSDVWAFGCVLYEMLTGLRAFPGEDVSDTLAAVLRGVPDWRALPPETPSSIRRLLRRALEKDRKRRLSDVADARLEIEEALTAPAADTVPAARIPSQAGWRHAALAAITFVVGALAAGSAVWVATRPDPLTVTRTTIQTSGEAAMLIAPTNRSFAITPDGSKVLYRAAKGLLVRSLDQLDPIVLEGAGSGASPFIAPDGDWVGYFQASALQKIPINGGPPVVLFQGSGGGLGATWAPDGTIVFAQTNARGLRRISADGGDATFVTTVERSANEREHAWPEFLPDGRRLLFTVVRSRENVTTNDIALLDLTSGKWSVLIRGGSHAKYLRTGHIVYGAGNSLRVVPFDLEQATVSGTSTPVVSPVGSNDFGAYEYDVANDGTLVYRTTGTSLESQTRTLVWVDRQGRETPLGADPRPYIHPRIAPDGTRVVAYSLDEERDLWIWDLAGKRLTRATFDPAAETVSLWTPDSQRLVFSSTRTTTANLFVQPANGTGTAVRLTESTNPQNPTAITPDGTQVIFYENTPTQQRDIKLVTLTPSPQVMTLLATRFDERGGVVSPNGRWLAYESNASGTYEIYVRPFPTVDGGLWQISSGGGVQPLWARNGRELFYVALDGSLMTVPIQAPESTWSAGTPVPIIEKPYFRGGEGTFTRQYDVSADGQRFLMIKAEPRSVPDSAPTIIVVRPWFEELKRLVQSK